VKLQEKDKRERNLFQYRISKLQKDSEELSNNRRERIVRRKTDLEELYANSLITFDQYITSFDQIEKTEESLIQEMRMAISEQKEEQRKETANERELLQKQLEAETVESPVSGRVVGITTSIGDFLSPGSPVILVQPDPDEEKMTFVVFISSEQVKPVEPGDPTELELSAFPPTKYGKLMAKVKSVSPMPLSSSGLMKELRNDKLVERITEEGSPFMVKVEILRDEKTGEFQWSSSSTAKRELQVGMVGQGSIITDSEKLFWLLFPKD
jgi:HlyD family secretion protein